MSSVMELTASQESHEEGKNERLDNFLNMDPTLSNTLSLSADTFLKAAMALKNQVVQVTWKGRGSGGGGLGTGIDPTVYTGLLGTAFTCLRSYEATGNRQDLLLSAEIVDTCLSVARASPRHVTFLCGRGGVYSLGAVVANYMGDHQRLEFFLNLFIEGEVVPNDVLMLIVDAVLAAGRTGASDLPGCPLMYRWHGTRYWGAANGLAGILHVLLHFPLSEGDAGDVKGTLRHMMCNRFPHSGNYPSSEGNPRDKLVQWSHGATSMAITLAKASQVYPNDREFRDAAIEAGEVVWKNGLVKKVGLADGIAGNTYAFLSLYRLTGETIYKERAKAFASFLYHNKRKLAGIEHGGGFGADDGYSLFQGLAGTACLWFDMLVPLKSKFPGYEL
ncbi:hypothetical protein ES332_D12G098300v1 [Gossypium tomentosum]|uniref:LanC-like protein GCL1 n=1 Tax=Gossypium tomentosum TaxID=34277 RepID=A0A5D2I833_GOSTO|nr:hypothetical protein ES332_D12G098300v1 [Gossypium tomentosum]